MGKNYSTNIDFTKFKTVLKNCNTKLEALKTANDALDDAMCAVYQDLQTMNSLSWYANMAGFMDNNTKWYGKWSDMNSKLKIQINAYQTALRQMR